MEFAVDLGSSLGSGKPTVVSAVVFCAGELIVFFSVVFYVHKFNFMPVINEAPNKW